MPEDIAPPFLHLREAIELDKGLSTQRVEVLNTDGEVIGQLSGVKEVRTYNRVGEVPEIQVDLIADSIAAVSR